MFLTILNPVFGWANETLSNKPNIVVIMTDDLGYSDLGCYGSEIDTPNLDALASNGVRFSQFYNTAKCHSSRVSLLTGQYCIAAGDTSLKHAVTSAEILRNNGYFTAMTGKWHLDKEPTDFGFDRYFGHLSGACNYFSGDNSFRLNGEKWRVPDSDFYTTVANVDYALGFIGEARKSTKPFYLYIAFNAPHAPLHALPQDYAKYKGRYDQGWDAVRKARIAKQKQLGLLAQSLQESPRPEHIPEWNSMEPWRRDYEANRMTTLAAMIDRVDREIGRIVADLKANNELDNTLILLVSDNGACPYDRGKPVLNVEPTNAKTTLPDSTGWAWARNSPFRYYKQNQFEGGISTPAIVHWPAGIKAFNGSIVSQPAHLIDVVPTLADITGATLPKEWPARELRPISGISLKPILQGGNLTSRPPIHLLYSSDRGLRDGDWKAVSFQGQTWELYNMAQDRTELNNLAQSEDRRLKAMVETWDNMTKNVLHASAKFSSPVTEAVLPHRHREWTDFSANEAREFDSQKKRSSKENSSSVPKIRARKNTLMKVVGSEIELQFNGNDPGIAIDLRETKLSSGPYGLSFRLLTNVKVECEVIYTVDSLTALPNGTRVSIPVESSQKWQNLHVELATKESLKQLRMDIGDGPGEAKISDLRLLDANGHELKRWP